MQMNRRNLLKSGMAAAALAPFVSAEAKPLTKDIKWDKEADIVIVGYGGADKHQVQMMVRMLLGIKEVPRPDDAADAVACAITHAHAGAGREQFRIK